MGKVNRKRYGSAFKAKVALEAIKGEETLSALSSKYGVHPTAIGTWKRQAVDGMAATFSVSGVLNKSPSATEVSRLHEKIGQLVVERDFLSKAFGR